MPTITSRPDHAPIQDLADTTESINMMVFGDSGAGKTVLAGTTPRALFLATENGVISAKRAGSKAKVWPCPTWGDVTKALKWLQDHPKDFEWVIIDSATEFQQLILRWILDRAVAENPNRDPDIPAIQDHQKWQNMFKRYVRAFNALPQNVLYTATAFRRTDEEGEDIVMPDILGQNYGMSAWLCASVHMYGYLAVKEKKNGEQVRVLITQTTGPYRAKDRYGALPAQMVSPTMPKIISAINGSSSNGKVAHA